MAYKSVKSMLTALFAFVFMAVCPFSGKAQTIEVEFDGNVWLFACDSIALDQKNHYPLASWMKSPTRLYIHVGVPNCDSDATWNRSRHALAAKLAEKSTKTCPAPAPAMYSAPQFAPKGAEERQPDNGCCDSLWALVHQLVDALAAKQPAPAAPTVVCCNDCDDDNEEPQPIKERKVREVSGIYTAADQSALGFFGRRSADSYFESAGFGFGLGLRDEAGINDLTILLGVKADGVTSIKRWSFGDFTPMFGAGGFLASGVSMRQNVIQVPTTATKTVTSTDPFGNTTVVTTDGDVRQPVAVTRFTTAPATGSLFINAGIGWDEKLFLLAQGGYDLSPAGNGWHVGGQFGGERFRVGGAYNFSTKAWGATAAVTLR